MTAVAKITENATICSTSLRASASRKLVGKMCNSVSTSVSGLFCTAAPRAAALAGSFTPTPGPMKLTTARPTASAAVVTISK